MTNTTTCITYNAFGERHCHCPGPTSQNGSRHTVQKMFLMVSCFNNIIAMDWTVCVLGLLLSSHLAFFLCLHISIGCLLLVLAPGFRVDIRKEIPLILGKHKFSLTFLHFLLTLRVPKIRIWQEVLAMEATRLPMSLVFKKPCHGS